MSTIAMKDTQRYGVSDSNNSHLRDPKGNLINETSLMHGVNSSVEDSGNIITLRKRGDKENNKNALLDNFRSQSLTIGLIGGDKYKQQRKGSNVFVGHKISGRRPSDNLLNMMISAEEQPTKSDNNIKNHLQVRDKNTMHKHIRPLSYESVDTNPSDLFDSASHSTFSSNEEDTTIPSSNIKKQLQSRIPLNKRGQSTSNLPNNYSNTKLLKNLNHSQFFANNNNSSKVVLTPCQKLRLRKELSEMAFRNSVKGKEKFFDECKDDIIQDKDIDQSQVWNIPMAAYSTTSFLNNTKKRSQNHNNNSSSKQRVVSDNFLMNSPSSPTTTSSNQSIKTFPRLSPQQQQSTVFNLPMSPIPGISNVSDFQYLHDTSKNLSTTYIETSNNLSKNLLNKRNKMSHFLPIDIKMASDQGMEDLLLISEDKLNKLSYSRPSWLPPKENTEKILHEREISHNIKRVSLQELNKKKLENYQKYKDEENYKKYLKILNKDNNSISSSNIKNLKNLIWDTNLSKQIDNNTNDNDEIRIKYYKKMLKNNESIETFEKLIKILNKIEFPNEKEKEINNLIDRFNSKDNTKIIEDLRLLLKLKSISQIGLQNGDSIIFYNLLKMSNKLINIQEIWGIGNLIQINVFNETVKEEFDLNVLKNKIIKNYLIKNGNNQFNNEFNTDCININTWWNIMYYLNHELFMWIIDILIIYQRNTGNITKIFYSLLLNVLMNYHFGFNDLITLQQLYVTNSNFSIPEPKTIDNRQLIKSNKIFIKKWLHYYKKF